MWIMRWKKQWGQEAEFQEQIQEDEHAAYVQCGEVFVD